MKINLNESQREALLQELAGGSSREELGQAQGQQRSARSTAAPQPRKGPHGCAPPRTSPPHE
jgi:hypothetical protein